MTQETTNTSPTSTERELTAEELEDVRGGSDRRSASQQAFAHKWNNGGSATAASMSNNNKKK